MATLSSVLICLACVFCTVQATTLTVTHAVNPRSSNSWEDTLFEMFDKDNARFLYLASLATKRTSVPIASGRQVTQTANYIVRVSVGTPPQTLLMAMDTSNDAAWLPCSGCVGCSSTFFDTAKSPEYKSLTCGAPACRQVPNPTCKEPTSACSFNLTYGTSSFSADLSQDTLMLGPDAVPTYNFACLRKVTGSSVPPQGLLGLGRGPLSLLSQTDSTYHSTFSYCLPSIKSPNFSGSLRLGVTGQPIRIKTTPLLRNPRRSSLYYVGLTGIRVGRKIVDIPVSALAFNPATGAGTVIDSGTVFTRLVTPAYEAVRNEFRRRINKPVTSLGGFDTCYSEPIVSPTMTFLFSGMNVTLPPDNLLIHSTAGGITCLAMAAAPANVNSVVNVIANMQQQNHRILFDVANNRVGVARETCS
ncbi:aspartyl protease AED3-like [Aristolochia californica]|uniref:aspartyl protease AED3-like n=1 Tax=Aristolochia californica TaxID=171875 RepID=UPI0035E1B797